MQAQHELENFLRGLGCDHLPRRYEIGKWFNAPAPGKSKRDRSLGIMIDPDFRSATVKLHSEGGRTVPWRAEQGRATALSKSERSEMRLRREAQEMDQAIEEAVKHSTAAREAKLYFEQCKLSNSHPYAIRKGLIEPQYVHPDGNLVVPGYIDGQLSTLQKISPNSFKQNFTGAKKKGSVCQLGEHSSTMAVGEGYATCARFQQVTSTTTVMTWDIEGLKGFRPPAGMSRLIILVDNDDSGAGQKAARGLHERLKTERPEIEVVELLPKRLPENEKGTDWADHTDETIRQEAAAIRWSVAQTVINKQYFTADQIANHPQVVIRSEHGTGKSTMLREYIEKKGEQHSILYVVPSQSLAGSVTQSLSAEFGFVDYRNEEKLRDHPRVVICLDSLWRLGDRKFHAIILDESEQIGAAMLKANATFHRGDTAGQLEYFTSNAESIIYLDADAGDRTRALAKGAKIEPHWIVNQYQPLQGVKVYITSNLDELMKLFEEETGQKYLFCAEKSRAKSMHDKYGGTLATGETNNIDLLDRIGKGELIAENIIANSAIGTGVSIDEGQHQIKTIFGILKNGTKVPSALDAIQGIRRPRGVINIVLYIPNSKPDEPLPTDPDEIIRREVEAPREITREFLKFDIDGLTFDERLVNLYAAHRADINRQLNDYRGTIIQRLEQSGATVTLNRTKTPKNSKRAKEQRVLKKALREKRAEQCQVEPLPEEKAVASDLGEVQRALYQCLYKLKLPEKEAREIAAREMRKTGTISGMKRMRLYLRGEAELDRIDINTIERGDPVDDLIAVRARLEVQLLKHSGIELGWISSAPCRENCAQWNEQSFDDYKTVTRNYRLDGTNAAGLVVRISESLGLRVERQRTSENSRSLTRYRVHPEDIETLHDLLNTFSQESLITTKLQR